MGQITRSRRAEIQREAMAIRSRGQRDGVPPAQIVTALRAAFPEVSLLEAWRLALGWSRAQAVGQVADLYLTDGLKPPGLSEAMLCRWEHGHSRPGSEYATMLARAYRASVGQLGLTRRCVCGGGPPGYGQAEAHLRWAPVPSSGVEMTTANGLPAVRESLHLALLDAPHGSTAVVDLAEAAVEHYALTYSRHAPGALFGEVHATRALLAEALAAPVDAVVGADLRRATGWLSALLGNLAFHLDDHISARAHLTVAASLGEHTGDARLTGWVFGAQSMLARTRGDLAVALGHAEAGLTRADGPLTRAQLLGWAVLPALARLGRAAEAEQALAQARTAFEAAAGGTPGRFGFDDAELALHEAEAWLALGRHTRAITRAEASVGACVPYTPGWAAAVLVLAQAEAETQPGDAAARALDVFDRVPADRLRSTARVRLAKLAAALSDPAVATVRDLRERVRVLPPIQASGATT